MQSKLNVAAAFYFELADYSDSRVVEHLKIMIVQGEDRSYNDGVTRVDSYRIDVLHSADRDGPVGSVTHDLEFDLLVASDGLLYKLLMYR